MVKAASTLSTLPGKKGKAKEQDGNVSRSDDDADYGAGKGKAKEKEKEKEDPNAPLRSCVIFVDVRTAEGEDAGSLFIDMLRGLGAKVSFHFSQCFNHLRWVALDRDSANAFYDAYSVQVGPPVYIDKSQLIRRS